MRDTEIRTTLLQERQHKPFNGIVDIASTIELAKAENSLVSIRQQNMYMINKFSLRHQNKENKPDELKGKTMDFNSLQVDDIVVVIMNTKPTILFLY